jgi:hypothetical protein
MFKALGSIPSTTKKKENKEKTRKPDGLLSTSVPTKYSQSKLCGSGDRALA